MGPTLVIEGLGAYPTACFNFDCGAKQACEIVSKGVCKWVPYDLLFLNVGSYVATGYENKPQEFAFGVYPMTDEFGNISSCKPEPEAKAFLAGWGLAVDHKYCGLSNWHF